MHKAWSFELEAHRLSRPAREILEYFMRNPKAVDSLEGIARWRLMEQAIHRTVSETEGALEWLVEKGYLIEVEQPRSSRLFRLNPAKHVAPEVLAPKDHRKG